MNTQLSLQERVVFSLRDLYSRFGYSRYVMSKFEPYDLYARNKDFLISDNVITFTDTNGQLMALKPDVTLSIVKNTRDTQQLQKLYYNENVYRVTKSSNGFREIMQSGLECLGDIDDYCVSEVLLLAAKSLAAISENCILSVSHLGILTQLLDGMQLDRQQQAQLLRCIGEKNAHELRQLCARWNADEKLTDILQQLIGISGPVVQVLPQLKVLLKQTVTPAALDRFTGVLTAVAQLVPQICVNVDFSVVDDIHYYNGFVFKGFVSGLPGSVLSGGEYNKLMQKMGRRSGAIGFAVYLDMLQQLEELPDGYDADVLLLCDAEADTAAVLARAEALSRQGSVLVRQSIPENLRCRRMETFGRGEPN